MSSWVPVLIGVVQIILMIVQIRKMRGESAAAPAFAPGWRPWWPILVMALLMAMSWVPYVLSLSDQPMRNALKVTAGTNPDSCNGEVNGALLMRFQEKYDVALACGIADPTIDKYRDERITVSRPFTIRDQTIAITVPFNSAMAEAIKKARDDFMKGLTQQKPPKGTVVFGIQQMMIWNNLLLLPKGADVAGIHRLSDVPRHGGQVLEVPQP